jgi:RHS repeat-associated protein
MSYRQIGQRLPPKGLPLVYKQLCAADLNGDGKTEAITLGPKVYYYYPVYPDPEPRDPNNPNMEDQVVPEPISYQSVYMGNALLINSFENSQWVVKDTLCMVQLSDPKYETYIKAIPCELNGDGRQDVMVFYPENSYSSAYFGSANFSDCRYNSVCIAGDKGFWGIPIDVDGDGSEEVISPKLGKLYDFNRERKELLLASITDGFNRETSIEYNPLTNPVVYTKLATIADYPLISTTLPILVTCASSVSNGVGGLNRTTYKYEGTRFHLQGRGFLGFTKFTSYEEATKTEIVTNFDIFPEKYVLYPKSVTMKIDGSLVSEQTSNYTLNHTSGVNGYFLKLDNATSKDLINSTTQTTTYSSYNDLGIPLQTKVDYGDGWSLESAVVLNTTTANKTLPAQFIQAKIHNGERSEAKSTYTYTGQDLTGATIITDGSTVTKAMVCDAVGNVTLETVQGKTTSYTYDITKRYVLTKTAPGNITTIYTYDSYGNLATQKDVNNFTTGYTYNSAGQLLKMKHPDGRVTNYTYEWYQQQGATYSIKREATGEAPTTRYFDMLGRELRSTTSGLNGDVMASCTYNGIGQKVMATLPCYTNDASSTIAYDYDSYGRLKSERGATVSRGYSYSGKKVTVADNLLGYTTTKEYDATGNLAKSQDLGAIAYDYSPSGKVKQINACGSTWSMSYNGLGARTALTDPNAGTILSTYNNLGQETAYQSPIGNATTIYDDLGRPITGSSNGEFTLSYSYDNQKKGLVDEVSGNGVTQKYTYDNFGRVYVLSETFGGKTFEFKYTYDAAGRKKTMTYPNGLTLQFDYNDNGLLYQITRTSGSSKLIGKLIETTATGQVKRITLGNGLTVQKTYNSLMQVTGITDGKVVQAYTYEPGKLLQMLSRSFNYENGKYVTNESFTYDSYNRLASVTGPVNETFTYAQNGNMLSRSSVGEFAYDTGKPHAIGKVSQPTTVTDKISDKPQDITYTAFGKVKTITEGEYSTEFTYGPDEELRMEVTKRNGQLVRIRYRLGDLYEVIREAGKSEDKVVCYIEGFDGLAAAQVKETGKDEALYFVHKDHLGSVLQLTNESGVVVETRSYDAWGSPRKIETGERLKEFSWLINRGYTEHEHLIEYRLINMQGRLYDPLVCRFLSPDPYIQSPENSQSYNRYAYCLNNPLMYKDPNGELFWFIAGAIIGAYIGGSAANHWKWNPTKWNFSNSDTWAYMAFGSLVGGFGGQLLLGPGGLIAGGSQLGVSIGAFVGNTFSGFATFAVSSSGVILQGVGYVTAAGGGVYVAFNQKLWNWDSGKKGKPEPKNYVETGGENYGVRTANDNSKSTSYDIDRLAASGHYIKTVDLTDVFKYPGVSIELNYHRSQGFFNPYTNTIHVPYWVYSDYQKQNDYIKHEYGHYLQLREMGFSQFMVKVAIPSMLSSQNTNHMYDYYEIDANIRSDLFFHSKYPWRPTFFDPAIYRTHH